MWVVSENKAIIKNKVLNHAGIYDLLSYDNNLANDSFSFETFLKGDI